MKNPAQTCILLFLIAAGLSLASSTGEHKNKFNYNIHINKSLDSYELYIKSLNPNNLFTINAAVKKFGEAFRHHPTNRTDQAFLHFWNFYLTAADYAGERLAQNERYKYLIGINNYNINPGKFKSLKNNLILKKHLLNENDFRLLSLLNSCGLMFDIKDEYLIVNFGSPNFILNNFGNDISSAMRDYISETIKEAGEKFITNNKLVISINKLAERTVWWENFIKKNETFILISECKKTYNFYLNTLLQEIDKASAPTYSQLMNRKLRDDYCKIIISYAGTKTAESTSNHYNLNVKKNFSTPENDETFASYSQKP